MNKIYEDVYFKYDENKGQANKVLICIHGFAGDKESSVIEKLSQCLNNTIIVAFDLPCHGEDAKNTTLCFDDCLKNLKTTIDFVEKEFPNKEIDFFATSFGAFVLLNYLKESKVEYNKIILRCPALNMPKIFKDIILKEHNYDFEYLKHNNVNLGYGNSLLVDYKFYQELLSNQLKNLSYINKEIFVLQGKKDKIVNYKENEILLKNSLGDKVKFYYFENADHRFKNDGELEKIVSIVNNIL